MNNNFTRNDILRRGDYRSIRKQYNILHNIYELIILQNI